MTITKTPVTEPNTRRLLLVTAVAASSIGYGKLVATVVRDAMEYRDPKPGESLYMTFGDDRNATGYRNAIWSSSKKSAMYIDDFQIRCQVSVNDVPMIPYGNDAIFGGSLLVDRAEVEAMHRTYTLFDRGMDKIIQGEGSSRSYASHLARSAAILGINRFLVAKNAFTNAWLSKPEEYSEFGLVDLSGQIDKLLTVFKP